MGWDLDAMNMALPINARIRRLLGRLLMLVIFSILIDTTLVLYRASDTISLGVGTATDAAADELASQTSKSTQQQQQQRIFIASTHWNNEYILRMHWNAALVELAKSIGPENVYVSIIESGSWDGTKDALRDLDDALGQMGVKRTISLDDTSHWDEISKGPDDDGEEGGKRKGWVSTPRGRKELRRIPYLSKQRNDSLKPLAHLEKNLRLKFDKILFLNDVVFTNEDFYTLLDTNQGSYAAACALDFAHPPDFYDTFALRDIEGHEALMRTWPYFRASQSRHALERGEATPVRSCWNSMVIMEAAPFYDTRNPLRFRGISDDLAAHYLEGSECCIIHADNPLSAEKGVWLNPNVRVGYDGKAYEDIHLPRWPLSSSKFKIWWWTWENRLRRWLTTSLFSSWTVSRRLREWEATVEGKEAESGEFCLVNEMHVLVANGWAHV